MSRSKSRRLINSCTRGTDSLSEVLGATSLFSNAIRASTAKPSVTGSLTSMSSGWLRNQLSIGAVGMGQKGKLELAL